MSSALVAGASLVATKLHVPDRRSGLLPRQALVELLGVAEQLRVILLSAPAGPARPPCSREWTATNAGRLAWLSLDRGDDDPVRLWTRAVHALRTVEPGFGARCSRRSGVAGDRQMWRCRCS